MLFIGWTLLVNSDLSDVSECDRVIYRQNIFFTGRFALLLTLAQTSQLILQIKIEQILKE